MNKAQTKILLVEDERVLQNVHSYFLQSLGYSFDLAKDGEQALAYLKNKKYDFILLDNGLPGIQGIEICALIRQSEKVNNEKSTPIVFLTADHLAKKECFEAGCNEFVIKPVSQEQLGRLIESWISHACSDSH